MSSSRAASRGLWPATASTCTPASASARAAPSTGPSPHPPPISKTHRASAGIPSDDRAASRGGGRKNAGRTGGGTTATRASGA